MSLNFDNFRPGPEGSKPVDPFANKRKALKPLRKKPTPPPDSIFNQRIDPTDFKKVNIEKAKRQFVPQYKRKKNAAQDESLKVANETFGQPLQEVATAISNKAQKDPVFTQTFQKQQTPGTKEAALKEYDMHRFGFTTSGDAQYNDFDRRNFADAIDKHLKDGHIDPGKWAQMMDTLKGKTGRQVLGLGPGLRENPESNFGDEATTAVAESIKASSQVPGQLLASPIEGIADEALPDGPGKNFVKGVAPLLGMVATGPLGVMAGNAQLIGSAISGEASKQITDTADTIKTIGDTNADPGTRWAGAVNLAVMAWGLIHGTKTMAKISKGPKFNPSDPIQAKAVLDEVESTHGPEAKSEVAQAIAEAPELFDTQKFTEDPGVTRPALKENVHPIAEVSGKGTESVSLPDNPATKELWQMTWQEIKDNIASERSQLSDKVKQGESAYEQARFDYDAERSRIGKRIKAISARANRLNPTGDLANVDSASKRTIEALNSEWKTLSSKLKSMDAPVRSDFVNSAIGPRSEISGQYQHKTLVTQALAEGKPVPPEVLADYPDLIKESTPTTSTKLPIEPKDVPYPQETIPNEKTVETSQRNEGARRLGDEAQGEIGRGERQGNDTKIPTVDEAVVQSKDVTGLANQVNEREALDGIISEVEKTKGGSKRHWQEEGRKAVEDGADYEGLADRVGIGQEELTGLKTGILLEGKRRILNEVNKAREAVDSSPTVENRQRYDDAQSRLDTYLQNVQAGKGRWSDVGRALQAGTSLDTGNFAEVLAEAKRKPHYDPKQDAKIAELTSEVAKRDAEIERLKANPSEFDAKQAVSRVSARRFNKNQIRSNIETNRTKLRELVGSGGVTGPKTRGAASKITAEDLKVAKDQALLIKEIALDHVRLGLANLEDVVIAVQKMLKDDGIDIERQAVIDAIATPDKKLPRSEQAKLSSDIRNEAKRGSTANKEAKIANIQSAIEESKGVLRTGITVARPKRVRTVTEEIADLEAQRKVYDSRVRAKLREMETPKGVRWLRSGANTVRGVTLGSDLGVIARQGLFSASRPKAFFSGLKNASKTMFSEENLAKWATDTENKRYSDGKSALRVRKEAGLSTTDALNSHEELIIGPLAQKLFGRKLGGSLERFQTTFINTVRNEIFDASYESGLTPSELKSRARFINNVTGRGNMKRAPSDLANIFMTSPRYEVSRWGTITEYLRNPAEALTNKGARQNLQDLAVTSAGVYALMQASTLAGYKVSFDPKSSDFLKMRKGNEVWDVTAGIAPRIRDVLRIVLTARDVAKTGKIDHGSDATTALGKSFMRTISPTIKVPTTEALHAIQKHNHIKKPTDMLSGYRDEGDAHGLLAFAPLIVQTFWQSLHEEKQGLPRSLGVASKEFIGTSVNFYKPRKSPSFKRKRKRS